MQQYKGHRNYRTVKVGGWVGGGPGKQGCCFCSLSGGTATMIACKRMPRWGAASLLPASLLAAPPAALCHQRPMRSHPQGVSFLGQHDEFVMSGSDCGHIYVWDRTTGAVQAMLKVGAPPWRAVYPVLLAQVAAGADSGLEVLAVKRLLQHPGVACTPFPFRATQTLSTAWSRTRTTC